MILLVSTFKNEPSNVGVGISGYIALVAILFCVCLRLDADVREEEIIIHRAITSNIPLFSNIYCRESLVDSSKLPLESSCFVCDLSTGLFPPK